MNRRQTGWILSIVTLLAITWAGPLSAGSLVTMESRDLETGAPVESTVTVIVDGGALRLDARGAAADEAGSLIFRREAGAMIALDHSRREYFLLDRETIDSIAIQMDSAMQQMQQMLADLPPDQRAAAEQAMQQRMSMVSQDIRPRRVTKTGERESVNGYDCEIVDVLEDGVKTRDMCVTPWASLEGGEEFATAMVDMAGFFEELRETFSRGGMDMMGSRSDVFSHMREIDGFPARSRDYDANGVLINETTLVSSEQRDVDPASFQPPADYSQQQLPQ